MEQKNRQLIVIAIIVLIAGAMFTSFGRNLFSLDIPEVVLPAPDSSSGEAPGDTSSSGSNPYHQVDVTPQTVQRIVGTLARPESYSRNLEVTTFWEDGSSTISLQIHQDGGWSHIRQVLPSGAIRHDLIGEETVYYWYDGSSQYQIAPADSTDADLAQRIPTYETVLHLETERIIRAEYAMYGELPCILTEVSLEQPSRLERYWVSAESGLLVCAESETDGFVTYRVTSVGELMIPCPAEASFTLPDGTILHSVS